MRDPATHDPGSWVARAPRIIRRVVSHTVQELREQRPALLLTVIVLCAAMLILPRRLASIYVVLAGTLVFSLRLAAHRSPRWFLCCRLPGGATWAWTGKILALFSIVLGLAVFHFAAFAVVSMLYGGGVPDPVRFLGRGNPANLAVLTLGLWVFTVVRRCPNRLIGCLVAVASGYVILLPVMWFLGGGEDLVWQGRALPVPGSVFGFDAVGNASRWVASGGWAPMCAVVAAFAGRLRGHEQPGSGLRTLWRSVAIMLVCTTFAAALLFYRGCEARLDSLSGRIAFQSGFVDSSESVAFLSNGRNTVRVDLRSGESDVVEGGVYSGLMELPGASFTWDMPRRHVYRGVGVFAHAAYKVGWVDGWNLLDSDAEVVARMASRAGMVQLAPRIRGTLRESSLLFLPDGRRCWFLSGTMEVESGSGHRRVEEWGRRWQVGHVRGFLIRTNSGFETRLFDLHRLDEFEVPGSGQYFGLGRYWLQSSRGLTDQGSAVDTFHYRLYDPDTGTGRRPSGLRDAESVLGVLMDGRVLVCSHHWPEDRFHLVDPVGGIRVKVDAPRLPEGVHLTVPLPTRPGPVLLRSSQPIRGKGWLLCCLDPERGIVSDPVPVSRQYSTMDEDGWVYSLGLKLEKVNLFTGERVTFSVRPR